MNVADGTASSPEEWADEVINGFKHIIKNVADCYILAGLPLPEPHNYVSRIVLAVTQRWPL